MVALRQVVGADMTLVKAGKSGNNTSAAEALLLRRVAETKRVVGFDITELCPAEGPSACSYTAAKLVYKLVAYATTINR